ncbi:MULTISPECIES: SDR family NAD(P)-dependent oxidoreductase [Chelativorans]|uniref:Short-chain dehydrogenase/reductase SDR n=1 Tax=Chelativorans sp. (strain BNC1) TaxID=266779 RepID=Q11E38_CHESB|nr:MULTISPECIES: SDR family oxidoreductase [Chelativorans]
MEYHKNVLITGAASGLGKAMTLGLLQAGYHVCGVDRDEKALDDLAKSTNGRLKTRVANLADPSVTSLIGDIEDSFGPIGILINNAGVGQGAWRKDYHVNKLRFYEMTKAQWETAVSVNATAVFVLSRDAALRMMTQGWGRIVNVTTSLGTMLRPGWVPYGPSKAAAEALSACMAGDLEGTGVTVNVMTPGGIANTGLIPEAAPYDRDKLIQPEVMIPPLLWLLSDSAAETTGMRIVASSWDRSLPCEAAASRALAPIGWRDLAVMPITPEVVETASVGEV